MATPEPVVPLVRNFKNNAFRYLFGQGENAADVLRWKAAGLAQKVDLSALAAQPGTFVAPDFQQLESDVLLRAPFLGETDLLWLYVLMEHQSEPDELMAFRCLRYVVLVYERQAQDWLRDHPNLRGFSFHPVLPVVFYWGARSWPRVAPLSRSVRQGALLGKAVPEIRPVFIDLARVSPGELRAKAGPVGAALRLVQRRGGKLDAFLDALGGLVRQVQELPAGQRGRGENLLWFAHALVYHARQPEEREPCASAVRRAAGEALLPEILDVQKTIAEDIQDQTRRQTLRQTLLDLLRAKYKSVPAEVERKIFATQDSERLDAWLHAFAVSKKLADIDFGSAE